MVIIVSILRGVAALVMRRDARVGIVAPVEARTTLGDVLLHLGLGARATSEISVTPNWRERRSARGEVVFGQRREAASSSVVWGGADLTVVTGKAAAVLVAGMERRRVGGSPAMGGEPTVVLRWLPVDGLEAVFELGRGTELPFADNGPDDSTASN